MEEKLELLEKYDIHNVVVAKFSNAFSQMSGIEYIKNFIVQYFHPRIIAIGYDHHFGKNRSGNIDLLNEYKDVFGYEIEEISKETLEDIAISSTKIRNALLQGNIMLANELSGHNYFLTGFVVKGEQMGRKMGFPTANIQLKVDYKLIPANGVYAVKARIGKDVHLGMLNIGYRPTFEGSNKTIEVHLFDFSKDIYGEEIHVEFYRQIRKERKFETPDALVQQLEADREEVLSVFAE